MAEAVDQGEGPQARDVDVDAGEDVAGVVVGVDNGRNEDEVVVLRIAGSWTH